MRLTQKTHLTFDGAETTVGDVCARYTAYTPDWVRESIKAGCTSGAELSARWERNIRAARAGARRGHAKMVKNDPARGRILLDRKPG